MAIKTIEEDEGIEEEEEKQKGIWMVQEIPTQTEPMVVNTKSKQAYPIPVALAQILNNQEKLMKLLD